MNESTASDALAHAVKAARLAAGFTQTELAKRTGLSQSYLSQIEVKGKAPSLHALRRIAKSTGVPLNHLVQDAA